MRRACPETPDVECLAAVITGERGADPAIQNAARDFAETQLHLGRVLAVKRALIRDGTLAETGANFGDPKGPVGVSSDFLDRLERLERYQRHATSQRQLVARTLLARVVAAEPPEVEP